MEDSKLSSLWTKINIGVPLISQIPDEMAYGLHVAYVQPLLDLPSSLDHS